MKTAKIIAAIVMLLGVVVIIGTVGTSDYMSEIGRYYPLSEMLKSAGVGLLMMVPYWVLRAVDDAFEIRIRIYRRK